MALYIGFLPAAAALVLVDGLLLLLSLGTIPVVGAAQAFRWRRHVDTGHRSRLLAHWPS
ncbi:hypothetical protein [Streptomyces sp. NPDC012510]|uniref:hypothetical protein n=1 Tax=Streptomyces sp. NPDC012510 TaxID=3364838 RepID=UPI0036EDB8DA